MASGTSPDDLVLPYNEKHLQEGKRKRHRICVSQGFSTGLAYRPKPENLTDSGRGLTVSEIREARLTGTCGAVLGMAIIDRTDDFDTPVAQRCALNWMLQQSVQFLCQSMHISGGLSALMFSGRDGRQLRDKCWGLVTMSVDDSLP